jgi:hypothetical protein
MSKLEAMLEQRGIATPREMSEAIARCQLHGGDLTTSLLQFMSADETLLSATLSECYGLPAAAVGLLPAPDDGALRSLPRDVAERYCCFPVEAGPGRLVLAVAHPLEAGLREELSLTLGVMIEERVALEVRIRQALSRFYGLPLSARNQRGIARLEGDFEAVGHETPLGLWSDSQLSNLPRPPSDLPTGQRDSMRPPSVRQRRATEAPRHGSSAPPSSGSRSSRRRGPLSLARAREELGRATTRNDVLDIFFGFASQFFEYSALFAVHNSLAEGLDAWGKGADRDAVLGIGVPLDLPSSLSEAAESCKVRLTRLGKEGIDRTLMTDLQRQFNAKALVLPVSLRGRCAVLLYADNGEVDVVEREVADVIAIAGDVANALGRIILQRKKEGARQRGTEAPERSGAVFERPSLVAASNLGGASDAIPIPLHDAERVPRRPVLAIGPGPDPGAEPDADSSPMLSRELADESPQPASSDSQSEPGPGEDPVFLLGRPQGKGGAQPGPPLRSPFALVQKPPVSITHPAPIIGSRPRLPSVIVDPESADPEGSERATRAAALTRAPTQARSSAVRRPAVPPPADAPRTLGPRERETHATATDAGATTQSPFQLDEAHDADAMEALAVNEVEAVRQPSEAEALRQEQEEAMDATARRGWPPPIMDNSPPPRQPPLTALVPIIIADPPKNKRGYAGSRSSSTDRAGLKPSVARTAPTRASSNPPASSHGPASPTVPSPARARKVPPAGAPGGDAPTAVLHAASAVTAASSTGTEPVSTTLRGLSAAAPATDIAPTLGEPALAAAITGASPAPSAANATNGAAPVRHATALARAAARSSGSAHSSPDATRPLATRSAPPLPAGARGGELGPTRPAPMTAARTAEPVEPATNERGSRPPLATALAARAVAPTSSLRPAAAEPVSRPSPARTDASSVALPSRSIVPGSATADVSPAAAQGSASAPASESTLAASDAAERSSPVPSSSDSAMSSSGSAMASGPAMASTPESTSSATASNSTESTSSATASNSTESTSPMASNSTESTSSATASNFTTASGSTMSSNSTTASNSTESTSPMAPGAGSGRHGMPSSLSDRAPDSAEISDPLAWPDTVPPGPLVSSLSARTSPVPVTFSSPPPVSPSFAPAASSRDRAPDSAEISDPLAWPDTTPPPPGPAAAPSQPPSAAPPSRVSLPAPSRPSAPPPSAASAPPPSRVSSPAPSRPSAPPPSRPSAPPPSRPDHAAPSSAVASRPPVTSSSPTAAPAPARPSQPTAGAAPPGSGAPTTPPAASAPGGAGDRPAIFPPPPPVDGEIEDLVERVCQGDLKAVHDLARIGASSLPQVMARFPGPVISERAGPSSRASECGPLLQALAAIGSPAMPSITQSSEHEDARVRRWATLLLGEMPGPEACRAVVQRLADEVPRVHQAALDAARLLLLGPAADLFRKTLFEVAEAEDAPLTLRLRTLEHVAKLKDSASVPRLIAFLAADMEPIVHKALWALTVVTRNDFGRDTRAWADFWQSNQSRHRLEWLIDALDDRDPRLRKAAADELREETGELFGYAEHLTRPERLEAQAKFRTWWQTTGAARHGCVS